MKSTLRWLLLGQILAFGQISAIPSNDNWDLYQSEILKEQRNFSGWCPTEKAAHIMNIINANNCKICVEVGVYGGSSFYPIVSALAFKQQGRAYAVDPWTNELCLEGHEEEGNEKHQKYWGKIDLDMIMHKFIEDMHRNQLDSMYQILRMSSAQACNHFSNHSIDFLHIDGNHSEQSALFDVENWLPKVKAGGIICFDDAWWQSTQPAIKRLLKECDIMKESSPKWQYVFMRKR